MNKKAVLSGVALGLMLLVLPAFAAVDSITGDLIEITFMDLGPSFSVQMDAYESNDTAFLLQEKVSFVVPDAPTFMVDHAVDTDLTDDTDPLNTGFFSLSADLTSGLIPENTVVNTYLLHFDTIGDQQARVTGSVTFDERILGLIVTETELEETDAVYGQEFVLYPVATVDTVDTNRGLELEGADTDWFVISEDSQTLTFSFVSKNKFDQVRIVTLDAADGPPLVTNCSGLSDAEFDIIPGNRDNVIFEDSVSGITTALFSSVDFDATSCLMLTADTLTFGATGDEMSLVSCGFEDFDNDGFDDLICDFNGALTGFEVGDTEGVLRARLAQVDVDHLISNPDFRLEYRDDVTVMEMSSQSVSVQTSVRAMQSGRNVFFAVSGAEAVESLELDIYDAKGSLVYAQNGSTGKLLRWNLKSQYGASIANGVYFYVVTAKVGDTIVSRSIGKIAVIR